MRKTLLHVALAIFILAGAFQATAQRAATQVDNVLNQVKTETKISDVLVAKVRPILVVTAESIDAIFDNKATSKDEKKAALKSTFDTQDSEMRKVLDDKQYAKYLQLKEKHLQMYRDRVEKSNDTSTGTGSDTSTGTGSDTSTGTGSDTSTGTGSDTSTGTGSDAGTGTGDGSSTGSSDTSGNTGDEVSTDEDTTVPILTRVDKALGKLKELLTLTDEQLPQVRPIIQVRVEKINAYFINKDRKESDKMPMYDATYANEKIEMQKVLSAKQLEKYNKWQVRLLDYLKAKKASKNK